MPVFKLFLSSTLVFTAPVFAEDAKPAAPAKPASKETRTVSPLDLGVKAFNMIQSASKLYLAMKVGAKAGDEDYLEGMAEKAKGQRLPRASVKNGAIYLQGLEKPIQVVDLKGGVFSYNGKNFDLNFNDGIEKGFYDLEKIVFPKSAAVLRWILPEAYADIDAMTMLAGIAGVGGLAMAANSCGDNGSAMNCGLGGLLGGFGLGYLIASLLNDRKPPQNMTCYPGQNGCQQVVLMGPNRVPVNTISQCPGQAYTYSPALTQVPAAQGQYMAGQLSSLCSYPGVMTTMNTAYAAPALIPLQPQPLPVARPIGAPAILPFGVKPQTTAVKPQTVAPGANSFKQQTVNEPAGAAR